HASIHRLEDSTRTTYDVSRIRGRKGDRKQGGSRARTRGGPGFPFIEATEDYSCLPHCQAQAVPRKSQGTEPGIRAGSNGSPSRPPIFRMLHCSRGAGGEKTPSSNQDQGEQGLGST